LHKDGKCLFLDQQAEKAKWLAGFILSSRKLVDNGQPVFPERMPAGLSRYWELTVDNSGELTGSAANLSCFRNF